MSGLEEAVVKWFDADRAFGFLRTAAGDVFVHINDVESEFLLAKGDRVQFQRGKGRDGREIARNVKILATVK
jgi:cold shock CspA family protein